MQKGSEHHEVHSDDQQLGTVLVTVGKTSELMAHYCTHRATHLLTHDLHRLPHSAANAFANQLISTNFDVILHGGIFAVQVFANRHDPAKNVDIAKEVATKLLMKRVFYAALGEVAFPLEMYISVGEIVRDISKPAIKACYERAYAITRQKFEASEKIRKQAPDRKFSKLEILLCLDGDFALMCLDDVADDYIWAASAFEGLGKPADIRNHIEHKIAHSMDTKDHSDSKDKQSTQRNHERDTPTDNPAKTQIVFSKQPAKPPLVSTPIKSFVIPPPPLPKSLLSRLDEKTKGVKIIADTSGFTMSLPLLSWNPYTLTIAAIGLAVMLLLNKKQKEDEKKQIKKMQGRIQDEDKIVFTTYQHDVEKLFEQWCATENADEKIALSNHIHQGIFGSKRLKYFIETKSRKLTSKKKLSYSDAQPIRQRWAELLTSAIRIYEMTRLGSLSRQQLSQELNRISDKQVKEFALTNYISKALECAQAAINNKNLLEAVAILTEALHHAPKNMALLTLRGYAQLESNPTQAYEDFCAASADKIDFVITAGKVLALAYRSDPIADVLKALEDYKKIYTQTAPQDVDKALLPDSISEIVSGIFFLQGQKLIEDKQFSSGLAKIENCLLLDPQSSEIKEWLKKTYLQLAVAAYDPNNKQETQSWLAKIRHLDPAAADLIINLNEIPVPYEHIQHGQNDNTLFAAKKLGQKSGTSPAHPNSTNASDKTPPNGSTLLLAKL